MASETRAEVKGGGVYCLVTFEGGRGLLFWGEGYPCGTSSDTSSLAERMLDNNVTRRHNHMETFDMFYMSTTGFL